MEEECVAVQLVSGHSGERFSPLSSADRPLPEAKRAGVSPRKQMLARAELLYRENQHRGSRGVPEAS